MSSPISVIREYLVSLGFSVDKSSYDSATKAIDSAGESLAKLAGTTVKQFGLATVAVTSFVTTAVVGMAKFLNDLGNAQIRYEMLARQMWTTQANAEALDTTLKAMGTTLDQLYLSPTLMQQFQELHSQAFQMMPPAEFQQQMAFIQSITYEFKRLKLEGTYALQWIGYYFIKYMAGPIGTIKTTLSEINDIIIKTMPYWTKVVAEVMSWFARFGVATVEAIKAVAKIFMDVGQMIPNNIKMIGLALLAILAIMNQSPLGWIIDGIIALGLAVDDFFTYIHGGQSVFGPFWQKLINLYNYLKDTGAIDAFKNAFKNAMKVLSNALQDVWNGIVKAFQKLGDFYNYLQSSGAINRFAKAVVDAFNTVVDVIKGVINFLGDFYNALVQDGYFNNLQKNFQLTFDIIGKLIGGAIDWFKSFWSALNHSEILSSLAKDFAGLLTATMDFSNAVLGAINNLLGLGGTQNVLKSVGDWITNFILASLQTVDDLLKQITSGIKAVTDVLHGNWGGAWDNFKNIFTKDITPAKQSYMYPSTSNHNTSNSNQTSMTVTQNIYGTSDPNATANASSSNISTLLRNQRGAIM